MYPGRHIWPLKMSFFWHLKWQFTAFFSPFMTAWAHCLDLKWDYTWLSWNFVTIRRPLDILNTIKGGWHAVKWPEMALKWAWNGHFQSLKIAFFTNSWHFGSIFCPQMVSRYFFMTQTKIYQIVSEQLGLFDVKLAFQHQNTYINWQKMKKSCGLGKRLG